MTYVLTGKIAKLDNLPAAEAGSNYYLNRFHHGGVGTVKLTVTPDDGSPAVVLTVTRDANGNRTVAATEGADANALIAELNREFVLLDAATFNSFMDENPTNRGRAFAGLLGLSSYSSMQQGLQTVARTQNVNGHFSINALKANKIQSEGRMRTYASAIGKAHQELADEDLPEDCSRDDAHDLACKVLQSIPLLKLQTENRTFTDISPDDCLTALKATEGGESQDRLTALIRELADVEALDGAVPSTEMFAALMELAETRDAALANTRGEVFRELYESCAAILSGPDWPNPEQCPACENVGTTALLPEIQARLGHYDEVTLATQALTTAWQSNGWGNLTAFEKLKVDGETAIVQTISDSISASGLSAQRVGELQTWIATLDSRATEHKAALQSEKLELEKKLPPSLVAVTAKVEAARRLQAAWASFEDERAQLHQIEASLARAVRIKKFLDDASSLFSKAEGEASARRLAAVEPRCREYFGHIMAEPIVPALAKRGTGEELTISLAEFWSLQNVSALALLSESYRNAFAISVYLAAASLYGGTPRFLILDDVTSSFDAGHQFQLVELIRTKFGRPANATGPQTIIFSHDTMLEKLFNSHSSNGDWLHQRIEGTARTEILPQSGAVNKVKEATLNMLNAGRVDDAAPRIRQYLEYKLEEILIKCKIPVPFDVAHTDGKAMPSVLIGAIDKAVKLHIAAGDIVLDAAQIAGLNTSATTITANYLAHWGTGQTQAFSAGSLLGVMSAIDAFADCFRVEHPAGSGNRQYIKALNKKI